MTRLATRTGAGRARRAVRYIRATVIPHDELGKLVFGQQHIETEGFFLEELGQYHSVALGDFPHSIFLRDHLDHPFSAHVYSRYLARSWNYYLGEKENTPERRRRRIGEYLSLYRDIEERRALDAGAIRSPVSVCRRPDGRLIIVDGNHRAAIALDLGLNLRVVEIPPVEHLSKVVAVPDEFYGTERLNRPYQSVFLRGVELVRGRRRDVHERMENLSAEDLRAKRVLDLGCNIGMNCYLAAERGAAEAVGIEYSTRIATAAVRLNAYFAAPCTFHVHDLNEELRGLGEYDTGLCFSVVDHLQNKHAIVHTIRKSIRGVLYFEGHAGSSRRDYDYLLNRENFSRVDLLGYCADGVHTRSKTRPLFRCEVLA